MIIIFAEFSNNTPLPIIAHTGCIFSTSSTTVMIIEPIPVSSGLSGEHSCEYYYNHQCSYQLQ